MRAAGGEVAVDVREPLPATISCDAKHMGRALANVVRNAVRHARQRVVIAVARDGACTTVHVDDDGPGIPPEERERLLEPFARLDASRARDAGGVGLGLAIVKSVAEWHGGGVHIAESPAGGARVIMNWGQTPGPGPGV
jgi:signal transduction histidine kinase